MPKKVIDVVEVELRTNDESAHAKMWRGQMCISDWNVLWKWELHLITGSGSQTFTHRVAQLAGLE